MLRLFNKLHMLRKCHIVTAALFKVERESFDNRCNCWNVTAALFKVKLECFNKRLGWTTPLKTFLNVYDWKMICPTHWTNWYAEYTHAALGSYVHLAMYLVSYGETERMCTYHITLLFKNTWAMIEDLWTIPTEGHSSVEEVVWNWCCWPFKRKRRCGPFKSSQG